MEIIIDIFSTIGSFFDSIVEGIYGTIQLINSLINFIISIIRILPNPLYGILLSFVSLYLVIFTYKIFRKG